MAFLEPAFFPWAVSSLSLAFCRAPVDTFYNFSSITNRLNIILLLGLHFVICLPYLKATQLEVNVNLGFKLLHSEALHFAAAHSSTGSFWLEHSSESLPLELHREARECRETMHSGLTAYHIILLTNLSVSL